MNEVVKKAILCPYAGSWRKKFPENEEKEILDILKEFKLEDEKERRIVGFRIVFLILNESKELNNPNDVTNKVLDKLSDYNYLSTDIIEAFQNRLGIVHEEDLKKYHDIFTEKNRTLVGKDEIKKYANWLVELFTYYCVADGCTNPEERRKEVEKTLTNKFNVKNATELNTVFNNQKFKSYLRKDVIDTMSVAVKGYKKEIDELCKLLISKSEINSEVYDKELIETNNIPDFTTTDDNIANNILNMFSNNKKETTEDLAVENRNTYTEKSESIIKKNKELCKTKEDLNENKSNKNQKKEWIPDKTIMHLEALANSLGYSLLKTEELNKEDNLEMNIKLLKVMADVENQFVLSELYNSYKNIDNITKENLEAILESFFVNLALNQFEVNEDSYAVGQVVKINTKDVLKEFKFNNAVSKDGEVEGIVKYLPWTYKGRQIVPMIIESK